MIEGEEEGDLDGDEQGQGRQVRVGQVVQADPGADLTKVTSGVHCHLL